LLIKTTAQDKIAKLRKRIRVVYGGTSASKTFSIIPFLIEYAINNANQEISIVSESIPHLRRGAMRDFLKIMQGIGMYQDAKFNKSSLTYKFGNRSYIEFFSADQPDKLRGARRDVLFINECNNVTFEAYQQLAIRTRKFIYLDYNPTHEFWVDTELSEDKDVCKVVLTYKDNEALEPAIVKEIEKARERAKTSHYWRNWWNVYGLGKQGKVEGVIYKDFKIIDQLPKESRLLCTGLDFGFTNDPTAAVDIYKLNEGYILNEVLYRKGLHNNEIYTLLKDKRLVYADSAEPKSISEMQRYGLQILPATKGQGSVMFGIQLLQSHKIFVTSQSVNLIKEMRNYSFDKDKQGNTLNKPIDAFNHCFVGSTPVSTIDGVKMIKDIEEGDLVLTSKGHHKVLKKFDNGIKKVYTFSLNFHAFVVYLTCTPDHKINTTKGWKPIQKLSSKDVLYLKKSLMGKHISCTTEKDILAEEQKGCIELFGSSTKEQYQKDTISITSMATLWITELKTLILYMKNYILGLRLKSVLKTTLNLLKSFNLKALKKLRSGISQQVAKHGILSMVRKHGLTESIEPLNVMSAAKSTKQDIQEFQNTAITTARLKRIDVKESKEERVYDLMIETNHEYFANGVLVHNCLDAARYGAMEVMAGNEKGSYRVRRVNYKK